jgi:hypothetical protein
VVPLRLVGQAVSTKAGTYAIRVASAAELKASAIPGGVVNLQARVVGAADPSGFYPFSMRIVSTPAGPALTELPTGGARVTAATMIFHLSKSATQSVEGPRDFCFKATTKFVKDFKKEWSTMDQTYMPAAGVKATAGYTTGQTTTFGVGVSPSGNFGSFESKGSYSISAKTDGQWQWYKGPSTQDYQVNYTPAKYHVTLSPGKCPSHYFTQPNGQDAGSQVVSAGGAPMARHCDSESPKFKFTIAGTEASTISAGMTVKEIGFSSNIQVGWDHTDTISFQGTTKFKWHICGVNADPAHGSPGRIVAALPR